MRAPLLMVLAAAVAAKAGALAIEARVRAPLSELINSKIVDSGRVACQLMAGCEKPVYIPDDTTGFTGRAVFKGQSYRPELNETQRRDLLKRIDALWGEPVSVTEELAPVKPIPRKGKTSEQLLAERLPDLMPKTLLDGSGAGSFYDRSRAHGGSTSFFAGGFMTTQRSAAPSLSAPIPFRLDAKTDVPAPTPAAKPRTTPYAREIAVAAARQGVPVDVLSALVAAKSGFRPGIAGGLTGLAPYTFEKLGPRGESIHDPQANLDVGARVLAGLLKQFDGDVHRALAAYQLGPRAVLISGGIPNEKQVHDFLAAYEREYRRGPIKPVVVPASQATVARRMKDEVQLAVIPKEKGETASIDRVATGVARWRPLIRRMAARHADVDPALMEAMVMPESGGDPMAVSHKGAQGLGQLMPGTAAQLGVTDPHDPKQNLRGMSDHLNYLLKKYENPVLAVAAYNAGEGRVDRAGMKIPYLAETRAYVEKVFDNYFHLTGKKVEYEPYLAEKPARHKKRATAASR